MNEEITLELWHLAAVFLAVIMAFMGKTLQVGRQAERQLAAVLDQRYQEPQKRRLPIVPECGSCAKFDLQAGQDAMAQHPAFTQASAHLSPHQMTRQAEHDDVAGVTPAPTEFQARWGQLGACLVDNVGNFGHSPADKCPHSAFEAVDPDRMERRIKARGEEI